MTTGLPALLSFTFQLKFKGLVQGIGFRPFVYQLASRWQLKGWVNNGPEGVTVLITTDPETAGTFLQTILDSPPPFAKITHYSIEKTEYLLFDTFEIVESQRSDWGSTLMLTPDFALCAACRQELHDATHRRYRYAFNTCTHCGPRYSIQQALPYDRPTTTMHSFDMCPTCRAEYTHPSDRRFYSQTNSCPECGVELRLYTVGNNTVELLSQLTDSQSILTQVKEALEQGHIVAVKGIGGYLLLCDANNEEAVLTLRTRKQRPAKPFAVMYPTLARLQEDAFLSDREIQALQSAVAPIVLVKAKETERHSKFSKLAKSINPALSHVGVMLPYAPLLELIARDFKQPLVATSGNVSGSPIVFNDGRALAELGQVADFILIHNRDIVVPQDDSVIRFSAKFHHKTVIRRSRGLAPNSPFSIQHTNRASTAKKEVVLAFGASLKSTFCLQTAENLYISQYLGDLEDFETQENFRHTLNHFLQLFHVQPTRLLVDAHEGYFSTQLALELGKSRSIPVTKIQHHTAHFAAVLAENELFESSELILGVIWDGTGYGTDGQVWGGEYFVLNPVAEEAGRVAGKNRHAPPPPLTAYNSIRRISHFTYFDAFLGDKMPMEPRLSAFSLLKDFPEYQSLLNGKFTEKERSLYTRLLKNNTLKTSSLGRIFDGVASLLGLVDKSSYEGEAALRLEELAGRYFDQHGYVFSEHYFQNIDFDKAIPTQHLIQGIAQDILNEKPTDRIAAKFHFSLVKTVEKIAEQRNIRKIAFSGGVFQNTVLVDLFLENAGRNYELYFHKELSPNDECISFGQMMAAQTTEI